MARGYTKAVNQARKLIYIEDQYLWSPEVAAMFATALKRNPELRLIAVLPLFPDQDGRISKAPNLVGRERAIATLRTAAPERVAFYGLESPEGVPVYVHAKVCVIDDHWASVGSDNFNRRSWTHDSEASAAVPGPRVRTSVAARPRPGAPRPSRARGRPGRLGGGVHQVRRLRGAAATLV